MSKVIVSYQLTGTIERKRYVFGLIQLTYVQEVVYSINTDDFITSPTYVRMRLAKKRDYIQLCNIYKAAGIIPVPPVDKNYQPSQPQSNVQYLQEEEIKLPINQQVGNFVFTSDRHDLVNGVVVYCPKKFSQDELTKATSVFTALYFDNVAVRLPEFSGITNVKWQVIVPTNE